MNGMVLLKGLVMVAVCALALPAASLTLGFTETFDADASGWVDATSGPLTWVASGGPDGSGYVESSFGSIHDPGTVQFRGGPASSGGNFAGDWLTEGVSFLSAQVIHDAPVPVTFFFRVTTGVNFPAAVGIVPIPVLPGQWTDIGLQIYEANPLIILEAGPGTFPTVFSAVTNVQVGVSVPVGFENAPFTYGLDDVRIVPEPGTGLLLAGGLVAVAIRRRGCRRVGA